MAQKSSSWVSNETVKNTCLVHKALPMQKQKLVGRVHFAARAVYLASAADVVRQSTEVRPLMQLRCPSPKAAAACGQYPCLRTDMQCS